MRRSNSARWVTCCRGRGGAWRIPSPLGEGSQDTTTTTVELRKVENELLALQLIIIPYFDIIQNIIFEQVATQPCFLQNHYCILVLGEKLVFFWIAQHISVLY